MRPRRLMRYACCFGVVVMVLGNCLLLRCDQGTPERAARRSGDMGTTIMTTMCRHPECGHPCSYAPIHETQVCQRPECFYTDHMGGCDLDHSSDNDIHELPDGWQAT